MSAIEALRVAMPRTGGAAALDGLERVLATGVEVGSRKALGAAGQNGVMYRVLLADAADASKQVEAILRPGQAQAPQEVFGWRIARALGVDHMFPAASMRDGGAAVQVVPGVEARAAGFSAIDQLRSELERGYRLSHPGIDAATQARVDVELARVVDYVVANSDRHGGNAMYDAGTGPMHLIDIGNMGLAGPDKLRPIFRDFGAGDRLPIDLHPRTVEVVRRNLTPEVLAGLHAKLREDVAVQHIDPAAPRMVRMRQRTMSRLVTRDAYLRDMVARRDQLVNTGRLEQSRMGPWVTGPLAVVRAWPLAVGAAGAAGAAAVVGGAELVREHA
ncbi:MAG: hypothetical protein JWM98_2945 [Thermoleophilia bacterium]|nr:hypothetical protein [Thermoleophilia bacterium]